MWTLFAVTSKSHWIQNKLKKMKEPKKETLNQSISQEFRIQRQAAAWGRRNPPKGWFSLSVLPQHRIGNKPRQPVTGWVNTMCRERQESQREQGMKRKRDRQSTIEGGKGMRRWWKQGVREVMGKRNLWEDMGREIIGRWREDRGDRRKGEDWEWEAGGEHNENGNL